MQENYLHEILVTESGNDNIELEKLSTKKILQEINQEDKKIAYAVEKALASIEKLIEAIYHQLLKGGRLFYIGSGTSGRLGIVDAAELPPTFGVPSNQVIGIIAGGKAAMFQAIEFAEDNTEQGWKDLVTHNVCAQDFIIGISASGKTPYVFGALQEAKKQKIPTGCIVCNPSSPIAQIADYPIEVVVGPEIIRGSTRMKAGTAQKMVLNMISTTVMIKLGHVKGNDMIDMQLSNHKLIERGTQILVKKTGLNKQEARQLLLYWGSVRKALENYPVKK
ncbi:MAG: N-acetylmuramic acid 6-phosphate etherase [Bacteroidia bacterium]|nr:N-acetylmuramic acid 6-phosphate etherase [Bacteroidia bacterium]MDW8157546.1 N-acetylmuramic acid 6-phosphate etherase [Bacteroidia bacterium]